MNALISSWMGQWWLNVLTPPLLLLAAYGVGTGLCRRLKFRRGHGFLVEVVLGVNFLALAALFGTAAVLPQGRWWLWGPVLVAAGYGGVRLWHGGLGCWWRRNRLAGILAVMGGVFMLGSSLIPPYAWDEQTYQLALPMHWLTQGTVAVQLDNPYSAYPALPQFVLLWAVALGGLGAAREVDTGFYSLTFLDPCPPGYQDGDIFFTMGGLRIPVTRAMLEQKVVYFKTPAPPMPETQNTGLQLLQR